ncbi:hypothetical protein [Enterococcus mundtii]|uniref:hypothetical protein n=1 Tax=Enterococcus mundtii TaxID=53346 RepID=UPI00114575C5|nr:hypothetical protein [Enterococcus mundtii]
MESEKDDEECHGPFSYALLSKKRMLYLERNIFLERGVSFMSWKQVYEQWATEESLEENLKKQLKELSENPEKLEEKHREEKRYPQE